MEQFLINDLERLSGIKAHTIRIWEKRYQLISPARTATNRRYYSNVQLKKLLNIAALLAQGHKISVVATLTDDEIGALIEELQQSSENDVMSIAYTGELIAAMMALDEINFTKALTAATENLGFFNAMMQVVYPFLRKTGLMWRVDKAIPAEEHFASSLIRQKIIVTTEKLPIPTDSSRQFMLFLPSGEWHEIGLLFANYIIRSKGYKTFYMGQNLPIDDAREIAASLHPLEILTFFISPKPKEELLAEIARIMAGSPKWKLLICGDPETVGSVIPQQNDITYVKDVASLLKILQ